MKKAAIISIFLSSLLVINAQNDQGKTDDIGRITLVTYVPEQIDQMPEAARSMLANKLSQITTQAGMGGSDAINQRFIITANIVVLTKDITATAPPMHALTLEITFYVGDGIEGTKFSSYASTFKGVGENETKAYISALRNLNVNNPKYQVFLETGKTKIIEYYNSRCDFIIKEAESLASQSAYDEAIYVLTQVPEVCKECYNKCMDAIGPIYQKKIDKDCLMKLSEANNLWNTSQNMSGADAAGQVLSQIDPQAACFKDAIALADKIAKRIKELDQRAWEFELKKQQDQVDMKKALIGAVRDIGMAFGNNQPKTVYRTRGWW